MGLDVGDAVVGVTVGYKVIHYKIDEDCKSISEMIVFVKY